MIIDKEEPILTFVQKPYEYQKREFGIEKNFRIFTAGNVKQNAAIVMPNNKLDGMLITQMSNEQDAVCLEIIRKK